MNPPTTISTKIFTSPGRGVVVVWMEFMLACGEAETFNDQLLPIDSVVGVVVVRVALEDKDAIEAGSEDVDETGAEPVEVGDSRFDGDGVVD